MPADADVEAWIDGRSVAVAAPTPRPAAAVLGQVHGTRVVTVTAPGVTPGCDAAVTAERGLTLTVRVADCAPVFLVSPGGLGMAHAGWRGAVGGILARSVEALAAVTGDAPPTFRAWIGPAIGPCCFEVGPEVAEAFPAAFRTAGAQFAAARSEGGGAREHVDLPGYCAERLGAAGVPADRIETTRICTRCHQHLLHSYRGSAGRPGRIEAWLRRQPAV